MDELKLIGRMFNALSMLRGPPDELEIKYNKILTRFDLYLISRKFLVLELRLRKVEYDGKLERLLWRRILESRESWFKDYYRHNYRYWKE